MNLEYLPASTSPSDGSMGETKDTWTEIPYVGRYRLHSSRDLENAHSVQEFLAQTPDAFERETLPGHITASACMLNQACDAILLTHHSKLDCWLPLGGHCDGIQDPRFSALRESYEESGLKRITMMAQDLFDIDIHEIPANGAMPVHTHYDLRFLLQADDAAPLRPTNESKALAWVRLDELAHHTNKPSVLVLRRKLNL